MRFLLNRKVVGWVLTALHCYWGVSKILGNKLALAGRVYKRGRPENTPNEWWKNIWRYDVTGQVAVGKWREKRKEREKRVRAKAEYWRENK